MGMYELSWVIIGLYLVFCGVVAKVAPKGQFELFLPLILIPLLVWWVKTFKEDIFAEFEDKINFLIIAVLCLAVAGSIFYVPWILSKLFGNGEVFNMIVVILFTGLNIYLLIKNKKND